MSEKIFIYGADPFGSSPSSKTLLKELTLAGFNTSELKVVKNPDDIPDNSWVISFGASAFKELTGIEEPLGVHHGSLCCMDTRDDVREESRSHVFVFPTYSPGYLYHNPSKIEQWKRQLELFRAVISCDKGAVL